MSLADLTLNSQVEVPLIFSSQALPGPCIVHCSQSFLRRIDALFVLTG